MPKKKPKTAERVRLLPSGQVITVGFDIMSKLFGRTYTWDPIRKLYFLVYVDNNARCIALEPTYDSDTVHLSPFPSNPKRSTSLSVSSCSIVRMLSIPRDWFGKYFRAEVSESNGTRYLVIYFDRPLTHAVPRFTRRIRRKSV